MSLVAIPAATPKREIDDVSKVRSWTRPLTMLAAVVVITSCDRLLGTDPAIDHAAAGPPSLASANAPQPATVGVAFSYDPTKGGTAFTDPAGGGLTYGIALKPALGLSASAGRITGVPTGPGVVNATVTAVDVLGRSASQTFPIAVFAVGLTTPTLPPTPFGYTDVSPPPLPQHFLVGGPGGPVINTDNTPANNLISDAGATLGRVLFYDKRLSANDKIACASCHIQRLGFSDSARFSLGLNGGRTARHAPGIANARFYARGRAFWDERAATLEDQALMPIQSNVEMGLTLPDLVGKVSASSYYPPLFNAAFGTPEVTSDRVARAIAQFVRAIKSTQSRFDASFPAPPPGPAGVPLTPTEQQGLTLFNGAAGCSPCHTTNAQVSDNIHNTGLDSIVTDVGAGNGRFKAPSLRNVGVRGPYMHDGRFATLQQVVAFYDSGVKPNPGLDGRLRNPDGSVKRLNLTQQQRDAIVAYMLTLTDSTLLASVKFSSPFPP